MPKKPKLPHPLRRIFWGLFYLTSAVWIWHTMWFLIFVFDGFGPKCGCTLIEPLQIEIDPSGFRAGQSYPIENQKKIKDNIDYRGSSSQIYIYTETEQKHRNSQLSLHRENCGLPNVIGEIHPTDFNYSQFVSGFIPAFFVGEDLQIYQHNFPLKEDRCYVTNR